MIATLAGAADFAGSNNVHPVGLVAVSVACALMFGVKRIYAPAVLLGLASVMPSAQRIVIAGADFNFVRLVVLCGVVRLLVRGDWAWVRWGWIDAFVGLGALFRTLCSGSIRGVPADFVTAIGANFEMVGAYLIVRSCIRSPDEVRTLAKTAAYLAALVVPFFLVERLTGRNPFAVFGGIPEITNVRQGKIRCRGAFNHPILAGCFFVAWIPIWMGMCFGGVRRERMAAIVGIASAFLIVFSCASSTPVVALLLGFAVWGIYPLRAHLRFVYLSMIGAGFVLHFVMTKPVWHLISRIDLVGGSTGAHRYRLIDAAIRRFSEWWFMGTPTTAHWGWGLFDVTNQFVIEGIRGGVWALISICGVFVAAYAAVGVRLRSCAAARAVLASARRFREEREIAREELLYFGVGAAMCAQMAVFLAVSYFGQTLVVWQSLMAIAACVAQFPVPAAARIRSTGPQQSAPLPAAFGRRRLLAVEPLPTIPGGGR
jgi:hypothetical protein